jgi:hypothetical protein
MGILPISRAVEKKYHKKEISEKRNIRKKKYQNKQADA